MFETEKAWALGLPASRCLGSEASGTFAPGVLAAFPPDGLRAAGVVGALAAALASFGRPRMAGDGVGAGGGRGRRGGISRDNWFANSVIGIM